eukprot:g1667.t1
MSAEKTELERLRSELARAKKAEAAAADEAEAANEVAGEVQTELEQLRSQLAQSQSSQMAAVKDAEAANDVAGEVQMELEQLRARLAQSQAAQVAAVDDADAANEVAGEVQMELETLRAQHVQALAALRDAEAAKMEALSLTEKAQHELSAALEERTEAEKQTEKIMHVISEPHAVGQAQEKESGGGDDTPTMAGDSSAGPSSIPVSRSPPITIAKQAIDVDADGEHSPAPPWWPEAMKLLGLLHAGSLPLSSAEQEEALTARTADIHGQMTRDSSRDASACSENDVTEASVTHKLGELGVGVEAATDMPTMVKAVCNALASCEVVSDDEGSAEEQSVGAHDVDSKGGDHRDHIIDDGHESDDTLGAEANDDNSGTARRRKRERLASAASAFSIASVDNEHVKDKPARPELADSLIDAIRHQDPALGTALAELRNAHVRLAAARRRAQASRRAEIRMSEDISLLQTELSHLRVAGGYSKSGEVSGQANDSEKAGGSRAPEGDAKAFNVRFDMLRPLQRQLRHAQRRADDAEAALVGEAKLLRLLRDADARHKEQTAKLILQQQGDVIHLDDKREQALRQAYRSAPCSNDNVAERRQRDAEHKVALDALRVARGELEAARRTRSEALTENARLQREARALQQKVAELNTKLSGYSQATIAMQARSLVMADAMRYSRKRLNRALHRG